MNENTNAVIENGDNLPETGEKTFTQEDVNRIVGERLQKEQRKADNVLVERERELAQRELQLKAKEQLVERGLAPELFEALNTGSEEALEKSLSLISQHIDAAKNKPLQLRGATLGQSFSPDEDSDGGIRHAMGLN